MCRVTTLSLSARIAARFADQVLVQWPELAEKYPQTKYIARFT
jgi:UDP-N-acetylglucosamine:LPS N-acetylglucosamine transferase